MLNPLTDSLYYGGGTFLAFFVPWLLLPSAWFTGVVLFYMAAATLLFLVVCGLGVWQDFQQPAGQSPPRLAATGQRRPPGAGGR